MFVETVARGRIMVGRLPKGEDLLVALTRIAQEENVTLGRVEAIGAVSRAIVGYYLQEEKRYLTLEFDESLEILNLTGNISLKDNQPFIHAHITLMRRNGEVIGGHLMEGTTVFACEYYLHEFITNSENTFNRQYDEETGLYLWPQR